MTVSPKQAGLIATIAVHVLALLIMIYFTMSYSGKTESPAGATVNFGYIDDGSGDIEPEMSATESAVLPETEPVIATPPVKKPEPVKTIKKPVAKPDAKILTSEDKTALAIKQQKQKERDSIRKAEAETKRLAELENERILAEQKKQAQQQSQINAIKGRMGKSFGGASTNTGSQGEGVTHGTGNQGDPSGSADSKNHGPGGGRGAGISFSLNGRSLVGSLAKPEYAVNDYGDVVVTITVDKNGDIIDAVPGAKGTTTTNSTLWAAARKAALSAKFNRVTNADAPVHQKGTITYKFKLY